MERQKFEDHPGTLWCDPTHVNKLLADTKAMQELSDIRNNQSDSRPPLSENLLAHLTEIYLTFEPVADRLIRKRMHHFSNMGGANVEDVIAEQNSRLWMFIADKFRWHDFSDGQFATGAFIDYLEKATGSFFARDLIGQQKQGLEKHRRGTVAVDRPVENIVIERENPVEINAVLAKWRAQTPEINVEALERRYVDGVSIEEQAVQEKISVGAIKRRLIQGKKSLYKHLKEAQLMTSDNLLSGKLTVDDQTREMLLSDRRAQLKKVLPRWQAVLAKKPKLKSVLFAYYGLGRNKPLYDYSLAAEAAGVSLASARVLVSEGVRLLFGKVTPSGEIQNHLKDSNRYQYWQKHKRDLQIIGSDAVVLDLYFKKGLTLLQIAKRLKVSEETVRRKKMYALELIDLAMISKED